MASPFPGMDPYIETPEIWSDFHVDLATEIRAHLNAEIQPNYYASTVTYVAYDVVQVSQSRMRSISPDVSVWHRGPNNGASAAMPSRTSSNAVALIDPPQIKSLIPTESALRLANVEIRQTGSDERVTAIEILSPINKRNGQGRQQFLRKRQELLGSDVHVMQIDLLRRGERSPLETEIPTAPYYVTLSRIEERPEIDVWAIQLQSRLPIVPIPLIMPDRDVALDLGMIVRSVYQRGGYGTRIDYTQPVPLPALDDEQKGWVKRLFAR
ncbi:MAG: DUF4058 family protein [Chloroflexota bacterium]